MNVGLRILLRVIQRKVNKGETLDNIYKDFEGLSDEEKALISSEIKTSKE
jgi:uncharacterized protein (DUF433 family)